jgi:hypothetical protein
VGARVTAPDPVSIVCAYPDGMLDTAWFRAYKRVKRSVKRASLNVDVSLRPLSDVDGGVDVVLLPPDLEPEQGRTSARTASVVTSGELPRMFDAEVERLKAEGRVFNVPSAAGQRVKHHGFEPVDGRARLAD